MTSLINPNNIDGSYPVAGQDNNSQGFRDNFTNTKVNFQYAEDEINDLQAKAVLKSALTGSVLDNNMLDNLIYAAKIQDFSATKVTIGSVGGSVAVNYASGHYQSLSTNASITLSFTNFPASPNYGYMKLQINITNIAHTVTLPASVTLGTSGLQGYNAGTITFGATGYYEFGFGTYDGGTTITIFDLNRALTNFVAADLQVDDVTATGNVTAGFGGTGYLLATGNVVAGQQVIATGNVSGGNVNTAGTVSASGTIRSSTVVSAVGNVISNDSVNSQYVNAKIRPTAGTSSLAGLQFASGDLLTTAAAGAVEYDATTLYFTPLASQRGVVESTQFIVTSLPNTLTQNTVAQPVFDNVVANGQIRLSGSTTYFIEGLYLINNTAIPSVAHSVSILFTPENPVTSIAYVADVTTSSGAPTAGATTISRTASSSVTATQITPAGTTTNSEYISVALRGTIRTNSAGNVTPLIQYNTNAPGGTSTVLTNSYIKFTPVGTSAVTNVGNWN
jgi:hypothetical protein